MFNQFLSITSQDNQSEIAEEEGIMLDHFRSAIDQANQDPRVNCEAFNYLLEE